MDLMVDQRLRPEESLSQRGRPKFEDVTGKPARGPRVRHVRRLGRLRRRRPARSLHDRLRHAVVFPPRVPVAAGRPARPPLSPDRGSRGCEEMATGQHAAPPEAGPHVRERDGALGRAARRLELERDRRGPRRRRVAGHLRHQRHVGRRPRPRRRARVLVGHARLLGRLCRRQEDFRSARARDRRVERDRYFHNRGGAAAGAPLFEDRAFLDGLDLETNGRAVVAFDANGDGALDVYVRSVGGARGSLLRLAAARTSTSFACGSRALPACDNRDGVGARVTAMLPGRPPARPSERKSSGYLSTGKPDRSPRPRAGDPGRGPDHPLAVRQAFRSWAPSKPWTARSSSTKRVASRHLEAGGVRLVASWRLSRRDRRGPSALRRRHRRRRRFGRLDGDRPEARQPDAADPRRREAGKFDWKVGESTVEVSAYFLTRVLKQ